MINPLTGSALPNFGMTPENAQATSSNGGWWSAFTGGLGSAVDAWGKIEAIKAAKNSTGQSRLEDMYLTEYDNGAAVQVEQPRTPVSSNQEPLIFGIPQKTVLLGSAALLLGAIFLQGRK